MASAVLGKVSPTPKGEYVSTQDYDRLDVVTYEGYPYLAKSNVPSGNLPTDELYWMPLLTGLDFAPGGYGLGEAGGKTTTDYNTCILGGVYNGNNAVNGPAFIANAPYANVVVSRGATRIYQTMYCLGKIAHRHSNNGGSTWEEWVDWSPSAFAPSGYGLGSNAISPEALDAIAKTGFYYANIGGAICVVLHENLNANHAKQTATCVSNLHIGSTMVRTKTSTWSEWEWVNPPMATNVAYRTTERFTGKPVYAKAVYVGTLPNNSTKTVDGAIESGIYNLVSLEGKFYNSGDTYAFTNNENIHLSLGVEQPYAWLNIQTKADFSNYAGFVVIKWTRP